jgi:hypothetical protein
MADLDKQAREMSSDELRQALSWNKTLRDHADENMQFSEYRMADDKVKAIEKELRNRKD